jgi:hypothetical protein
LCKFYLDLAIVTEQSVNPNDCCFDSEDVKSTEEPEVRRDLEKLLVATDEKRTRSRIKSGFTLKPIEDLKVTLREAPFAFGYIQRELGKLIFQWASKKMPSLNYLLEDQDWKSQALPCPRAATSVATQVEGEGGQQVQAEDEGNVDFANDNEVDYVIQTEGNLGSAQKTRQKRKPKLSQKNGDGGEEEVAEIGGVQIFDDEEDMGDKQVHEVFASKKRKRAVRFTREEKNAIREGVEKFGTGNWSLIRDMYDVLQHRKDSKTLKVSAPFCLTLI